MSVMLSSLIEVTALDGVRVAALSAAFLRSRVAREALLKVFFGGYGER